MSARIACTAPAGASSRRTAQRGAAALMVVMVLFFLVSLVAAYASRNLIFEQRISVNQYRSTQAFEAAEAGLEWALSMLNSGRVTAACAGSAVAADTSFRERYLTFNANGTLTPRSYVSGASTLPLLPGCSRTASGWSCSCPTNSLDVLTATAGPGSFPAFRVRLFGVGQAGMVRVAVTGCTAAVEGCLSGTTVGAGLATATISQVVALKSGLFTPPAAALTSGGTIDLVAGSALRVSNTDPATNGITVNAGGTVDATDLVLSSVPGAPTAPTVLDADSTLSAPTADRRFANVFGMRPETYRRQPSALVFDCTVDCSAGTLRTAASLHPGRPLWVTGDLQLDSDGDIGSPTAPTVLVVTGNLAVSAASVRIFGLVYSRAATWTASGSPLIQGAAIAEGNLAGTSSGAVVYDPDILGLLTRGSGSFVRVPGGWRDF